MKINVLQFVRIFALVPVNDWTAFVQRVGDKILKIWLISRIINVMKTPLFYLGLIALLTYSPDTVAWIFIKIGEIEITVMAIVLSSVMPDIFANGSSEYSSWSQIWTAGLQALPEEMVQIMNALGVAQLLGYVTATIGAVATIRIIRGALKRARLM